MKVKAVLFDVLLPIFTYMLGIATAILGLLVMIVSVHEEKPKRGQRVTYQSYTRRGS